MRSALRGRKKNLRLEGDITPDPLNGGLPRGRRKRSARKGQWTTPPTQYFGSNAVTMSKSVGTRGFKRKNSPSSTMLKRSKSSENLRKSMFYIFVLHSFDDLAEKIEYFAPPGSATPNRSCDILNKSDLPRIDTPTHSLTHSLTDTHTHTHTDTAQQQEEAVPDLTFEKMPIVVPVVPTVKQEKPKKRVVDFVPRKIPNAVSCPNLASLSIQNLFASEAMDDPFNTGFRESQGDQGDQGESMDPFGDMLNFVQLSPSKKPFKRSRLNKTASCPDLSHMKAVQLKIQKEDERRQKRLARNRESARLRRLRKKTTVEHLRLETATLDETLRRLKISVANAERQHRQINAQATPLYATFLPNSTNFKKTPSRRHHNMNFIFEQCFAEVEMLEKEIMYPCAVVNYMLNNENDDSTDDVDKMDEDEEFDALDIIDRAKGMSSPEKQKHAACPSIESEEQRTKIEELMVHIETEATMLKTLKCLLKIFKQKKWHTGGDTDTWDEALLSVLSLEQAQRYFRWTAGNQDTIKRLFRQCMNKM